MFRKPIKVAQYTLEGKHIKTYNSINEASKATGISQPNISWCVKGEKTIIGGVKTFCLRAGQFQWRDASKYTPSRIKPYNHSLSKRTAQYDVMGNLVGVYKSRKEGLATVGLKTRNLTLNNKKVLTQGTYQWRDGDSHPILKKIPQVKNVDKLKYNAPVVKRDRITKEIIETYPDVKSVGVETALEPNLCYAATFSSCFENYRWGRPPYQPQTERWKILQYSINGSFIKEYNHIVDVAKEFGVSKQRIHQAVKGLCGNHLACGFQWFSKTDLGETIPKTVEAYVYKKRGLKRKIINN